MDAGEMTAKNCCAVLAYENGGKELSLESHINGLTLLQTLHQNCFAIYPSFHPLPLTCEMLCSVYSAPRSPLSFTSLQNLFGHYWRWRVGFDRLRNVQAVKPQTQVTSHAWQAANFHCLPGNPKPEALSDTWQATAQG